MNGVKFSHAKPVWVEGREKEQNLLAGARVIFEKPLAAIAVLRITASGIYRFYVNGIFAGHGPARGPHGYYRVDEWDLSEKLHEGSNIIAVEVAGYNVNSYYLLNQPSFVQAEVVAGSTVLAATSAGSVSFEAFAIRERLQKVQRYSFQRPFVEEYRLSPGYDIWHSDASVSIENVKLQEFEDKKYIPRGVPYPEFSLKYPLAEICSGEIKKGNKPEKYWRDRSLTGIGPSFLGYGESKLENILSNELQEINVVSCITSGSDYNHREPLEIGENSYHIYDFGVNTTGFIGAKISCSQNTRLIFVFDEILMNGDIDFKRLECVNAISFELQSGSYRLESIEPYTLRFLKLIVLHGECSAEDIQIREYKNPDGCDADFKCDNEFLNCIYTAGKETFRQNAVDIFMDCPSRERAGWLCDSFFTARAENDLTGKNLIERNFFENYLLPDRFEYLPEGMLPMCYPADHNNGVFIPNWALWFVVELEEYLVRSNDRQMIDALKNKIYKLFDYFKPFKNEYGLLEKLDNWVFVEWSKANELVQDVNYPTNMLYAGALAAAGRIYDDSGLSEEAENLFKTIEAQSFNGKFFVDNAVRENGVLKTTGSTTEVCQYYAFFFDIARPETHPDLWNVLVNRFGPARRHTGEYPEVYMANAFIGNYLRLEILSRYGMRGKLLTELESYFFYMAEKTGTLWEHTGDYASCNHGFASHVVHSLYRDGLGVKSIDRNGKVIEIEFRETGLNRCEGYMPFENGALHVKWWKEGGRIKYCIQQPETCKFRLCINGDMKQADSLIKGELNLKPEANKN